MLVKTLKDFSQNKTLKDFGQYQNPKGFWSKSFSENIKEFW